VDQKKTVLVSNQRQGTQQLVNSVTQQRRLARRYQPSSRDVQELVKQDGERLVQLQKRRPKKLV